MIEAEALRTLIDTAQRAAEPKRLTLGGPAHVVHYVQPGDGALKTIVINRNPRNDGFAEIEDLAGAVRELSIREPSKAVVYVGQLRIVAILDDCDGRRERLFVGLTACPPYARLKQWSSSRTPLSHKALIQTLRLDFAGCLDPAVLSDLRAIEFARADDGTSQVKHGDEAITRSVRSKMYGGGKALPEEMLVTMPSLYLELSDLAGYDVQVRCLIDIDTADGTFLIVPLAGELEREARKTARRLQQQLRALLAETSVPVYCGEPS